MIRKLERDEETRIFHYFASNNKLKVPIILRLWSRGVSCGVPRCPRITFFESLKVQFKKRLMTKKPRTIRSSIKAVA